MPDDALFDRVFPAEQRFRSYLHWTPVDVARRACALLAPERNMRVLDIGAGVGKLCLVGAMHSDARWFGIERDREMVRVAIAAAEQLGVAARTSFAHGKLAQVDWPAFDAFYLFNPFAETLFACDGDALERRERYVADIAFVQDQLASARPGTRVVTYHGFGGDFPPGYELVHREPAHEDELCVWVQRTAQRSEQPRARRSAVGDSFSQRSSVPNPIRSDDSCAKQAGISPPKP